MESRPAAAAAGRAADGIPEATAAQTVVLPWNDIAALVAGLDAVDDVAAVIVEPVARGVLHPDPAFLRALRDETTRRGIVLIFDEVVVWPRVGLSGAQGLYGVTPDLTALGKALGGGLPLGALAGRREPDVAHRAARRARGQTRRRRTSSTAAPTTARPSRWPRAWRRSMSSRSRA